VQLTAAIGEPLGFLNWEVWLLSVARYPINNSTASVFCRGKTMLRLLPGRRSRSSLQRRRRLV